MKIYHAKDPNQAHILAGLLTSHGIRVEVRGDKLFGLRGEIPMTSDTTPYLWLIDLTKQALALDILHDFEHNKPAAGDNWRCPSCEEIIEAQFEICWQCGYIHL